MPRGIYPRSEYHRMIISKSKKGTRYSVEARLNMNKDKIGKPRSEETKKKISLSHKGKKLSVEHRAKLSAGQIGTKRPHTDEHRRKLSESHRGCKSYLWEGGKTELRKQIYNLFEYKEWRRKIYVRDGYSCVLCKIKGGKLAADHIVPFSIIIRTNGIDSLEKAILCAFLWDIGNGRTLCLKCHKETPTFGVNARYVIT